VADRARDHQHYTRAIPAFGVLQPSPDRSGTSEGLHEHITLAHQPDCGPQIRQRPLANLGQRGAASSSDAIGITWIQAQRGAV
jgi:hypothetical protein